MQLACSTMHFIIIITLWVLYSHAFFLKARQIIRLVILILKFQDRSKKFV